MTAEEVVEYLRAKVKQAGSQSAFARETGCNLSQLSQVLNGSAKLVPRGILTALSLHAVVRYLPIGRES